MAGPARASAARSGAGDSSSESRGRPAPARPRWRWPSWTRCAPGTARASRRTCRWTASTSDAQLDRLGLRERKGAPETFDRDGYAAILARVSTADEDVYVPGFERELEQPLAAALVVEAAARVVVSEGNYLLLPGWEQARTACDEVWWVELDDAVRRERLVARHTAFGKPAAAARAWVDEVDEVNAELIRATRSRADRVIRETPDGWVLS